METRWWSTFANPSTAYGPCVATSSAAHHPSHNLHAAYEPCVGSQYSMTSDDPIRLTCHPHEGAMTPSPERGDGGIYLVFGVVVVRREANASRTDRTLDSCC